MQASKTLNTSSRLHSDSMKKFLANWTQRGMPKITAERRYDSWERAFLFKHVFKKAFAKRNDVLEEETAKVTEFEEQQKLSRISTQIDIDPEQAELFFRLRDQFAALTECSAIWDIKTRQATNQVRERTTASTRLSRDTSPI